MDRFSSDFGFAAAGACPRGYSWKQAEQALTGVSPHLSPLIFNRTTMTTKVPRNTGGFTLTEIMIVVVILALLAAIAVPGWLRARKRSQAGRILEDLVQLDHAMDQYAIDNNKGTGSTPTFTDLRNYVKTGSVLYSTGADLFGDNYGPFTVDSLIEVPLPAFTSLSDVAPTTFWSPYPVQ